MKKEKVITFKKLSYMTFQPSKMSDKEAEKEYIKQTNAKGYCVLLPVSFRDKDEIPMFDTRYCGSSVGYAGKKAIKEIPTCQMPKTLSYSFK